MPTKTFPTIAAIEWLKTLKLPAADRLELNQCLDDLELFGKRVAELDVAISEVSARDEDAILLATTRQARRCNDVCTLGLSPGHPGGEFVLPIYVSAKKIFDLAEGRLEPIRLPNPRRNVLGALAMATLNPLMKT